MTPRTQFILTAVFVVSALVALVIGLTLGLQTSAPENGGSPPYPDNSTTVEPTTTTTTDETPSGSGSENGADIPIAMEFLPHMAEKMLDEPWDSAFRQFRYAAVASDTKVCSQIGTDILARLGGSAVDAAIATTLCVGVVNAHSAGIGGGHFMTVYATPRGGGEKRRAVFNSREMAPAAATENMFVNDTTSASTFGGLAIAVPGEIRGFHEAWLEFGRLEWRQLFEPTIRLCADGFTVEASLASAIDTQEEVIRADDNLCAQFVNGEDCATSPLFIEGDTMRCEKLGVTLQRIADNATSFYDGSLTEDIVADIQEYNGTITLEDLRNYFTSAEDPLEVTLHNGNFTVIAPEPPSSGVVLAFMLKVLDGYNLGNSSTGTVENRTLTYHRAVEAMKFAYARRTELGDPAFLNVSELVENMTSDAYTAHIRAQIDDARTFNESHYGAQWAPPGATVGAGTAHESVIAPDGSAVSVTSTINLYFGSKVRGNRTGIIFNNEMDDFSTPGMDNAFGVPPSPANFIVPGKRPLSSMTPAIVFDAAGQVALLTGASGGTRITTSVFTVCMNSLWLWERLDMATDLPRFHHQLAPNSMQYERNFDNDVLLGLKEKGHEVEYRSGSLAVVQSIENRCRLCGDDCLGEYCIHAVSDGRKGGVPDGY